jgi:hypothetical protein
VFVYVLNCHSQPFMPCSPRKARFLLKEGKAKVVKMIPFTIQLLYGSSGYKQEVSLGIDAGAQHLGVSATTEQTVLFEAEVLPRNDIQELLATRRQYRRARRNRKTRYRKARFLNRKKAQGWLATSRATQNCLSYQFDPLGSPDIAGVQDHYRGSAIRYAENTPSRDSREAIPARPTVGFLECT